MLEHAITHSDPHKQGKGHLQKSIKKKSCNLKQRQERDVLAVVLWKGLYHVGFFIFLLLFYYYFIIIIFLIHLIGFLK